MESLLSQALTAFAIEYERERAGPIAWAANVLRGIGDDGVDLASLPSKGTHSFPNLARLGVATVDHASVVRLTTVGRSMRDAFEPLTARIEARWRIHYGGDVLDAVIDAVAVASEDLPRFPVVVWTGVDFALSGRPENSQAWR